MGDPNSPAQKTPASGRWLGMLRTLGLDLVGPLLTFQLLRSQGLSEVWSLVLSGTLPAIGVAFDWIRWRTLEVIGVIVLSGIALSIVLALISNDPKIVLLEGAMITAAFGIACLVSVRWRRPMIFYFAQAFNGGRHSVEGAEMDTDYNNYSEARSFWRTVTIVWGVVNIAEALVRVVVVERVSTATALTVNRTVPWLIFAGLFAWTYWWGCGCGHGNRLSPDDQAHSRNN